MAFDAGTTSSRCIIFNRKGEICEVAQKELTQHYPKGVELLLKKKLVVVKKREYWI